jgi:sterol desaturase/sphingolipid hydroxylase (fatty acid hydroxylase superfamily)
MRTVVNAAASIALAAIGLVRAPELLVGLAVAAAVGMCCEVLAPLHEGKRSRRAWVLDLTHALGDRAVIIPVVALGLALVRPAVEAGVPAAVSDGFDALPGVARVIVLVVITDFVNYWAHRAFHQVRSLWAFHAVHHSSERLDWLATSRVHPLELAANVVAVSIPAMALGSVSTAPWLLTLFFVYPFVTHANAALRVGRVAGWLFVTPVFHHWHHAVDDRAHDKNYGQFLSVWDRWFGTYVPDTEFPEAYGIGSPPLDSADYVGHLTAPLGLLSRRASV